MNDNTSHSNFPFEVLNSKATPFYYYDMALLRRTLDEVKRATAGFPYHVHYALKANGNPRILAEIANRGLGADLVSGGEIVAARDAGFKPSMMCFAGVGKTDAEIRLALDCEIGCFNVESLPELEVIDQIALEMGRTARVALRVNPDIDAHTHRYITTGTADNKFGICLEDLDHIVDVATTMRGVKLCGLHFHIGSQITLMQPYVMLCEKVNELVNHFADRGIHFEIIDVGGGLGIDYDTPDAHPLPDFEAYFGTFKRHLRVRDGQQVYFELGRSIVGQCGSLITRVTYVKHNRNKQFAIVDAGMSDLLRPALYQAHHAIDNLTSTHADVDTYDVVGPICESSDTFARDCQMPLTARGDLLAIRSAGAYGESMASQYNMRRLPDSFFN